MPAGAAKGRAHCINALTVCWLLCPPAGGTCFGVPSFSHLQIPDPHSEVLIPQVQFFSRTYTSSLHPVHTGQPSELMATEMAFLEAASAGRRVAELWEQEEDPALHILLG